jgi:phosphatidylglycerophosphate synthase
MHKVPMRENFFEGLYSLLSSKISPFFIRTSLTPNQVTIISGVFGVVGACMLAMNSYFYLITSAILIQAYTILDLVDGDIARAKGMQSYFGMWLDIFFDKLIDFLIIIFLSIGVFIKTDDPFFLICGVALMGFVFSIQFIMVLNDTYFKNARRTGKEFIKVNAKTMTKKNSLILYLFVFFRKHLSMQHTTFTFIVSIIAAMDVLEGGLIFLTVYSFLSLVIGVVINFYQIK